MNCNNDYIYLKNNKGSLTLEAAILVPLFLFFAITLLSLMDMLHFYGRVEQNLHQSARKMAVYAPAAGLIVNAENGSEENGSEENDEVIDFGGAASSILGVEYAKNNLLTGLTQQDIRSSGIIGSSAGFNMMYSRIMTEGDVIDLIVSYQLEPRNNFFFLPSYPILNRCRTRAWTGYDINPASGNEAGERMVYITETGTVFHLTETCTYLDLSIHSIRKEELDLCRNQGGSRYNCCELCGMESEIYYITDYGDCYHSSLDCSGLKRTIIEIPISQVGDRHACSRCGTSIER